MTLVNLSQLIFQDPDVPFLGKHIVRFQIFIRYVMRTVHLFFFDDVDRGNAKSLFFLGILMFLGFRRIWK